MTCWKYCNTRVVVDFAPFRLVPISLPPFCNLSDQFGVRIFFCSSSSSFSCCHPCDTFLSLSLSLSLFFFFRSFFIPSFVSTPSSPGSFSDVGPIRPYPPRGDSLDPTPIPSRGPSLAAACATFDAPKALSFRVRLSSSTVSFHRNGAPFAALKRLVIRLPHR